MKKRHFSCQLYPFIISAFILSASVPSYSQRCDVNGILFNQQAGFGSNSKIMIGGYGQNDGSICFNCYSDSTTYGVSRSFNRPVGMLPPVGSPVPAFSARVFQDLPAGVLRIQTSPVNYNCYSTITWNSGVSINASGAVGIGTDATFGAMLAVNGMILSRSDIEVNISHPWPDFVFDKNYKRPDLAAWEKEIKTLGYIPQIGPGKLVSEGGLRVGEMQAKQMLVIEYLVLNQFDFKHRVDSLDSVNKVLVEKIISLSEKFTTFEEEYLKLSTQKLKDNSKKEDDEHISVPAINLPLTKPEQKDVSE